MRAALQTELPLQVQVGGRSLAESMRGTFGGLRIHQRLSMPAECELYLVGDRDALSLVAGERGWLAQGQRLTVNSAEGADLLFDGDLTGAEFSYGRGSELEVFLHGYDFLHRLRRRQGPAAFEHATLGGLVRAALGHAQIDVRVSIHRDTGTVWPLLIQHEQNDLEFLTELAAREGLYLVLSGDTVHLLSLEGLQDNRPPQMLLGENLLAAQLELDFAETFGSVEVVAWSAETARARGHKGSLTRVARRQPDWAGEPGQRRLARKLVNERGGSAGQVEVQAQAELDRLQMSEATVWGRAQGDTQLHPGTVVEVGGVAPAFAGRYVITQALHTVDAEHGYTTEFRTDPPVVPSRPRCDIATLGTVGSVDDPHGRGRVHIALPAYGNVDAGWLPVLHPGGGANKGLFTSPDVGDTVLVMLLREDPAQGVVLGGLYGTKPVPYQGDPASAGKRYTWTTAGGQIIQLAEKGDHIRLETKAGAAIELSEKEIVIKGAKIDFRSL